MEPDVTLILSNGRNPPRPIAVRSNRFTIGRGPDNDLTIDDPGLSRRHALIEKFGSVVQASDCASRNGTLINGTPVREATSLRDGDTIEIGDACTITVCIGAQRGAETTADDRPVDERKASGARRRPAEAFLRPPVIAIGAAVTLLVTALIFALLFGERRQLGAGSRDNKNRVAENGNVSQVLPASGQDADTKHLTESVSIEQIEKAAAQVMRRVSSDDRPYVFPSNAVGALQDIKRQVELYSVSSSLEGALGSLGQRGSQVAAEARREGIEPYLVIYTALAETDGGRTRADPAAAAREVLPRLQSLRATFGTELADKSLIIVAAYKMGGGTKKSHPLLDTMRRVVKNPQTERNVWYLHEHGGLGREVYDFVVKFLALGIIAQNPRQFGVEAAPLAF